ncbi:GNAT family N-acetyltransferase [Stygiolobus caldivivus]|uniref:Ribosomal-protein-alanine N-acetyltransferase RimI n=1 Tax=Stygiolobus caldivivus TaxID=2824673 RepID=A0A8D5U4B4_9CREN|nr:N-acetyltransferase [Stygiolobus caldivivus]BCU69205.1 ribosomal-protein-alanine N-acetyltransferase RimI [Stygiolobus caldivivus]
MIIITNASEEDLRQIYEVEIESFDNPYPYSLLKAYYFLSGDLFIVAKDEQGRIKGYSLGIIQYGYRGHVVSIAVRKSERKRGVGSLLLRELETRFKGKGCSHSYLEVNYKNEDGIIFYKKLGYIVVKLQVNYYGRGQHAFIMVKDLLDRTGFE